MKLIKLTILISLTAISCGQLSKRQPASNTENKAFKSYTLNEEKAIILSRLDELSKNDKSPGFTEKSFELNQRLVAIEDQLRKLELNNMNPQEILELDTLSVSKTDRLIFHSLDSLSKEKQGFFMMAPRSIQNYQIEFVNLAFAKIIEENNRISSESNVDLPDYKLVVELQCDANFSIKKSLLEKNLKNAKYAKFDLYDRTQNYQKILFIPSRQVTACQLTIKENEWIKKPNTIVMKRFDDIYPSLSQIMNSVEVCSLNKETTNSTNDLIWSLPYRNITCPLGIDRIEAFEKSEKALNEKAKVLLGQDLPEGFIKNQNPRAHLDFSKAPQLDAIFISYLVFRNDFSGGLIARLLQHHAEKGTPIWIQVSKVITLKKDRPLLYDLAFRYGNVKLQEFQWQHGQESGEGGMIAPLHRTLHTKLFLTYSEKNPDLNVVMIGGRNIHDGFLYKNSPGAYSPDSIKYGEDESWASWQDFEAKFVSKKFTVQVLRHFYKLWNYDSDTFHVQSPSLTSFTNLETNQNDNSNWLRHLVSVPYKDQMALESLYAEMIDKAKTKILISTPYFRPTGKIGMALKKAVERGVYIQLITRLDLEGDTADIILSEVNKQGINKFYRNIDIHEYTAVKQILHTKMMLIDDEFTFLGGVNLNKRSFYHDIENAVLIHSKDFNAQLTKIFSSYLKESRKISEKQKTIIWKRIIIGIFDTEL